jgi:hypothetical protein
MGQEDIGVNLNPVALALSQPQRVKERKVLVLEQKSLAVVALNPHEMEFTRDGEPR